MCYTVKVRVNYILLKMSRWPTMNYNGNKVIDKTIMNDNELNNYNIPRIYRKFCNF